VLAQQRHRDHRRVPGQDAGVVRCEQRAPVGRDAVRALDLDPPPAVVEEAEERLHQVGEVLVEAPLVVLVVPLEPAQHTLERVAGLARERRGAARERVGQLESRVEPFAQAAHEGKRGGVAHAAATQSSSASTVE
jgi:hypothetical protein